jgi:hypothetical protein
MSERNETRRIVIHNIIHLLRLHDDVCVLTQKTYTYFANEILELRKPDLTKKTSQNINAISCVDVFILKIRAK